MRGACDLPVLPILGLCNLGFVEADLQVRLRQADLKVGLYINTSQEAA
jgi:hypothetical protein